ncbi:SDR family NAD(P)-dependent oxidoreductase [Pseudomonadota bacterium]
MSRTAFVTGAAGFIGSHLVDALMAEGWTVKALVHYNSMSSWGWLEHLREDTSGRLQVVLGDVQDPFQMQKETRGCHTVFNLASLIAIPYSYDAPASYVQTNVNGTLNILKAALDAGVERVIHVSTSETYGTAKYVPIDEKHPLQGQSPYSASKIAGEKFVESFFCSFDLPAVVIRPFNTYGPRQSARAVIPTIISQALRTKEISLGSLDPQRDLTFVSDTVAGFIAAANAGANVNGETINLGVGKTVSIGDLAELIFELMGGGYCIAHQEERKRPEKSEVMRLLSDNSKAAELLDWRPQVSLREGLARTIEWIRENPNVYQSSGYVK